MIRFGSFRRFIELPNTFSTFDTAVSVPTTLTRSPTCRLKFGFATKSTPARLIRVMLIPYSLRNFKSPKRFPFSSGFVIRIRRLTNWLSIRIHCLRSMSMASPMKILIFSASCSVVITKILSFSCNTVLAEAMSICLSLSLQIREITKSVCSSKEEISATVLLKMAGFFTTSEIGIAPLACEVSACSSCSFSFWKEIRKM